MIRDNEKKHIALFFSVFVLALLVNMVPKLRDLFPQGATYLYLGILMAWGISLRLRILKKSTRSFLLLATAGMEGLFFLRLLRYSYFEAYPRVDEYVRYAYYLCFILVPAAGLSAALTTDTRRGRSRCPFLIIWILWGLLGTVIMTNGMHGWLMKIHDLSQGAYTLQWLYYVVFGWCTVLTLTTFIILLKWCRVLEARRYWFNPLIFMTLGAISIMVYYMAGGAPSIGRIKLYNLQEAFSFLFVTSFESLIQIGLIPSNSDHLRLLRHSGIGAAVLDREGKQVFSSKHYEDMENAPMVRRRESAIPGGKVVWFEDVSSIEKLSERLQSVTETMELENELIRREAELEKERISYETKNRLYDRVAEATRKEADRIEKAFSEGGNMRDALIPAAYIKRCGNLMLLCADQEKLPVEELGLSLQESLQQLTLFHVLTDFQLRGEGDYPAADILLAYRVFETVLEEISGSIHAFSAELTGEKDRLFMQLSADAPSSDAAFLQRLSDLSSQVKTDYTDETLHVFFSAGREGAL